MQSPFLCTAKIPPTVKASGSTARAKAEPTHPGTDHIPPATSAPARAHRAHPEVLPLPHHRQRAAHRHPTGAGAAFIGVSPTVNLSFDLRRMVFPLGFMISLP